jgi:Cu2+-exporting ATPase
VSWRYVVVHAVRGRVRLRLTAYRPEEVARFAHHLAAHPAVVDVRWVGVIHSLTVRFDGSRSFQDVVGSLPDPDGPLPIPAELPAVPLWRSFLLPAASLTLAISGLGPLARILIGLCSLPVLRRAVRSLLARSLTIDVLDATAISLLLVTGDVLAAGVTTGLVETGERLRQRASGRARRVLRGWMGANAREVRVLRGGSEPHIETIAVQEGERVVVYAGETVPVDGIVISGSGSLDTRTWTGEPIPRAAEVGTTILAGTVVADGRLVIAVAAVGERTRAGRLAAALEDAIAANTRVSDRARRIANAFVAPVFLLSGAVYLLTRDLSRLISVLIIDFGTGVRIAIPTTVLTTMIAGARNRVLFKSGLAIEQLAGVDTVVFDKTGTLTSGDPSVLRVVAESGHEVDETLRLAAAAEGHLPHPIARAIRRSARARGLSLPEPEWVRYQAGGGVSARVNGRDILVGDQRLLERHGIPLGRGSLAESSIVLIAVDGRLAAQVRLRDRVKQTARLALDRLRAAGISRLWLATGDHERVAATVSHHLGMDGFRARMMPEDKLAMVRSLRAEGARVAVVGDGINDASAMAAANVSVALPQGADLARETADIVLLDDDLESLVAAVRLAREAMAIVRQNIGLVAAPNSVGLALAALGGLTPLSAALVNNGSTLLAGANALRPLTSRLNNS